MRIILQSPIFPPEPLVAAQTTFSLARELSLLGHKVLVVTAFPNRPGGKIYQGYQNLLFLKEKSDYGFEIIRCFTAPSTKSTFPSRFLENIVFGISSSAYLLFALKADMIFIDTWPIFAAGLTSLVARLRGIPYIVKVVDLHPESIVSQKRLVNDHWAVRLMRKIDQWIAQGAVHVVVITNSFAQVYRDNRKIPPEKISVARDWVEGDLNCVDNEEAIEIRHQFKIADNDFLAAYGGNIGVAAGVDILVKACASVEDIRILIAGSGSELQRCQQLAMQFAPDKISFYSPWPEEKTMAFYQAADVLVLPTFGEQSIASIPSKLIRYMLSGRPVISACLPGTELDDLMKRSGCGWTIPPDDEEALRQAIMVARCAGPVERMRRGLAGREYALQNLTANANLPKMIDLIEKVPSKG